MQPTFRILADSVDITKDINDRLLNLSITDESGINSDQVRLTLDDRRREDGAVASLPRIGAELEVWLGYAETELLPMGKYMVDEIELRSPPAILTVGGRAADMGGTFKNRTSQSWDKTTLGELVTQIAQKHGYTPKIDPELGAIALQHEDQVAESDMALLTRLAEKHDAVAKPVNGYLVLARAGEAKAITGAALPAITLAASDVTSWSFKQSSRSPGGTAKEENGEKKYGGCRAWWHDIEKNETKYVTVGKEPFEDIPFSQGTEAKAKAAVASRMNKGKRQEGGLSLTLPGNPLLAAECRLHIAPRPGMPTNWRIKKVEHTLSNSGYTTQVEAELFLENQEKVTA